MIKNKFINRLLSLFNISSLAILALLGLAVALLPTVNKFGLFQPVIVIFFGATIFSVLMIFASNMNMKWLINKYVLSALVIILFIAMLITQLIFARALVSDGYTWDANTIFQAASSYAQSGVIDKGIQDYFESSPNNIPLFLILSQLFSVASMFHITDFLWVATILNVGFLFLAQVLIYLTCNMLFGRRIAICSLPFSFILLGLSMHVQEPYTDTLTVVFPILLFYLSLQFIKLQNIWLRLGLAGMIGFLAVVGYLIKPTVIIAPIALSIVGILWMVDKRKSIFDFSKMRVSPIIISVAVLVVASVATYVGYGALVDSKKILSYPYSQSAEHSYPLQHFMNIGMKSDVDGYSVNYGGYNDNTAKIVSKLPGSEAKIAYSVESILNQLSDYGFFGYAGFLGHKVMWIMSDATFFAYGEGDISKVDFKNNDPLSEYIRQFAFVRGEHYQVLGNMMQIVWVSLLFFIALQFIISILWTPARTNLFLTALHLMIIGIIAFVLIFEGRSRYLFLYVPIFIVVGMYTLNYFRSMIRKT